MSGPADAMRVLLALAVVLVACHAAGLLARRLGQPPVVGEIVAGILAGPTLWHGAVGDALVPADVRPALGVLADIGLALFMFLVGLELDRRALRGDGRTTLTVTAGSLLVPFGLGVLAALWLVRAHPGPGGPGAVLFLGTAMAVTAFPVLARIVRDRGLADTPVGRQALTVAAVGDVVAWAALAVLVALTRSGPVSWTVLLAVPYVVLMVTVVPRVLRRLTARSAAGPGAGPGARLALAPVVAGVLVSAALTGWMGLHLIFGAFLAGLVLPRAGTGELRAGLERRVAPLAGLLLPVYFVTAGLGVDLSGLGSAGLLEPALILLVATGGKLAGVYGTARLRGIGPRPAAVLATLLNVRGLTELVLLQVGHDAGLIDDGLYALMVAMAVVTTVVSGPVLGLILRRADRPRPPAPLADSLTETTGGSGNVAQ